MTSTEPPATGIRAEMPSGQRWNDPSEDLLFELISDVERGDEEFMIVLRAAAPGREEPFIQLVHDPGAGWLVEHRAGGPDTHRHASLGATFDEKRLLHQVVVNWAYGVTPFGAPVAKGDWQELVSWEALEL